MTLFDTLADILAQLIEISQLANIFIELLRLFGVMI